MSNMINWLKKRGKKTLAVLLTAAMVLGMIPGLTLTASAEGTHPKLTKVGTNTSTYDQTTGQYKTQNGHGGQSPAIWLTDGEFAEGTIKVTYRDLGVGEDNHQSDFGIFLYEDGTANTAKYLYVGFTVKNGTPGWFWQARFANDSGGVVGQFLGSPLADDGSAPAVGEDAKETTLSLTISDGTIAFNANGKELNTKTEDWDVTGANGSNGDLTKQLTQVHFDQVGVGTVSASSNTANVIIESIEIPGQEVEPEPEPEAGPCEATFTAAASNNKAYDNFTDVFESTSFTKWGDVNAWLLNDESGAKITDFENGTVTLQYIDHGVDGNPSEFGAVLRFNGTGESSDSFLYIGYSPNQNGANHGWFWQYRNSGGNYNVPVAVEGAVPHIDGQVNKLKITAVDNAVTEITFNDVEIGTKIASNHNGGKTLSELFAGLPAGGVGFAALSAKDQSAKAHVTIQSFTVAAAEAEPEPVGLTFVAAHDGNGCYDNETKRFKSEEFDKWNDANAWLLDDEPEEFSTGTVTLTYVDNGVDENPSDFGVMLKYVVDESNGSNDSFLYIGYSQSIPNSGHAGWFWQVRQGGAGFFHSAVENQEAIPHVGQENKLEIGVGEGIVTVKINDIDISEELKDGIPGGGGNAVTLVDKVAGLPNGRIGIASISARNSDAKCNVTVQNLTYSPEAPTAPEPVEPEPEVPENNYVGLLVQNPTSGHTHTHFKPLDFGATEAEKTAANAQDMELPEGFDSGTYEVSFRTLNKIPGNLGFLFRFNAENQFQGVSYDFGDTEKNQLWATHDSIDGGRSNVTLKIVATDGAPKLEPNTSYMLQIVYTDSGDVTVNIKENTPEAAYQEIGTWNASTGYNNQKPGNYYTGTGGFAVRMNSNSNGGGVVIESIKHSSGEDNAIEIDYRTDYETVDEIKYVFYDNGPNNTTAYTSGITVKLAKHVDLLDRTELQAAIGQAEQLTPEKDKYTEGSWKELEKAKAEAQKIVADDTVFQDQINQATQALLDAIESLVLNEVPEDPGLEPWVHELGEAESRLDTYEQNMYGGDDSTLGGGKLVNVNQEYWGMDGKALTVKGGSGDPHIIFTSLGDSDDDGSISFTFSTGETAPTSSVGFLFRYQSEANYCGISIEEGQLKAHYASGNTTGRTNTNIKPFTITENSIYKVKITFKGSDITVSIQKEGESALTVNFKEDGAPVKGGKFAVRLRGSYQITMDNLVINRANGSEKVKADYNGNAPTESDFTLVENKNQGTASASFGQVEIPASEKAPTFPAGKATKVDAGKAGIFVDQAAPRTVALEVTAQVFTDWNSTGLVLGWQDDSSYLDIRLREGRWVLGGRKDGTDVGSVGFTGEWTGEFGDPDGIETRTLRADLSGIDRDTGAGTLRLTVSAGSKGKPGDAAVFTAVIGEDSGLAELLRSPGKVGVITYGKISQLLVGQVHVSFLLEAVKKDVPKGSVEIGSDQMRVWVDRDAPFIYKYDAEGKVAYGSMGKRTDFGVKLNDAAAAVKTKQISKSDDSIIYSVRAAAGEVEAEFTVRFQVKETRLVMTVLDVDEISGTVRTFEFPDLEMLSFVGLGAEAAIGRVDGWGPATDEFAALKGAPKNKTYGSITYLLLSDRASGSVGALENNVLNGKNKYKLNLVTEKTEDPYMTVTNTHWYWKYYENTVLPETDDEGAMYYDRLPFATVVIGGDENGDGKITWQDAGVAYRTIMTRAFGWENTKNEWMYIAMNMSSQASQPFLRVLDTAKAISYLTDGFGLKIMNKGYQGGGHDDSHGDYDFVGLQQGGAEDFNRLIDIGLEYGVKNGVHMNVTEFALDSTGAKLGSNGNLRQGDNGLQPAWKWFDQAFAINKEADISRGLLEPRLDAFEEALPHLDFVYMDVYQDGSDYESSMALKILNGNGITLGTEALGDFNQGITFVHWNTDMYYAIGGTQSQIMRFVVQGQGDLNAPDRALLGSLMPGVGDWRNTNNFSDLLTSFYRNNLPTKYLQHFDLMEWTADSYAKLTGHNHVVISRVEGNITVITLDGKLIARVDTSNIHPYLKVNKDAPVLPQAAAVFIPWSPETEDKIYYYSDMANSPTLWDLPDSWSGVETVYVYELTSLGRTGEAIELAVNGGKVDVGTLDHDTPYILLKENTKVVAMYNADGSHSDRTLPTLEKHPYGEFTGIQDPGFTREELGAWTFAGAEGGKASIVKGTITDGKGNTGQGKGDPRVAITGGGTLSQEIDVIPGRTYTFSVWAYSPGQITLTVKSGESVLKTVTLPDTESNYTIKFRPTKYFGTNWQRLRLEGVAIPEGLKKVTLELTVNAGNGTAYVDDFRSWVWNGMGAQTVDPEAGKYYYFEDFENLDENWGPFVSTTGGQPLSHLAYKFGDGSEQIKTFVIDGTVSLKGSEGPGDSLPHTKARTLPATLNFQEGQSYTVSFDYQTYREVISLVGPDGAKRLETGTAAAGTAGQTYFLGYNVPLEQSAYQIAVRRADGSIIATYPLEPSVLESEAIGYSAKFKTNTITFPVDATGTSGIYLTLDRTSAEGGAGTVYVIDNFRVTVNTVIAGLDQEQEGKATLTVLNPGEDLTYYLTDEGKVAAVGETVDGTVVFTGLEPGHDYTLKTLPADHDAPEAGSADPTQDAGMPVHTPGLDSLTAAGGQGEAPTVTVQGSTVTVGPVSADLEYALMDPANGSLVTGWRSGQEGGTVEFTGLPAGKTYTLVVRDRAAEGTPASVPMELTEVSLPEAEIPQEPDPDVPDPDKPDPDKPDPDDPDPDKPDPDDPDPDKPDPDEPDPDEPDPDEPDPDEPDPDEPENPNPGGPTGPTGPTAPTVPTAPTEPTEPDTDIEDEDTPLAGALPYRDVQRGDWFYDYAEYLYTTEIMTGVTETDFQPQAELTRAQLVMALYKLEGRPQAESRGFEDVAPGQWYTEAVDWAAALGIVNGYDGVRFGPEDSITRQQVAVVLYRYALAKGYDVSAEADLSRYTDAGDVDAFALEAMRWANAHKLILGTSETTLDPTGPATRAQIAAILTRFCQEVLEK